MNPKASGWNKDRVGSRTIRGNVILIVNRQVLLDIWVQPSAAFIRIAFTIFTTKGSDTVTPYHFPHETAMAGYSNITGGDDKSNIDLSNLRQILNNLILASYHKPKLCIKKHDIPYSNFIYALFQN